ncbi:uncharacterized protein LOC134009792 isoform X1 [Osmerus eperlanus]|uniref:uncharacterized protein LOC134009792 isoform X1 n=1 Tax=Osmerus eperlanus TaxID=29151 RepID=UPI002E160EEC
MLTGNIPLPTKVAMILSSLKHIVNVVPLIGHLRWKTLCKSGKISGDTFHQSFMEWAICRYEVDKMCQEQPFVCPPCTPEMLAVAVDGNRKHYRFKKAGSQDSHGHLDGVFLCEDSKVSEFVDHVHKATKHVPGKGVCGGAEFAAAKEISRKSSSKLDEEGIELAVCRHGTILRGLNMFRGEIYAYALYLQKELGNTATFFCTDLMCKYWPYLQKVCRVCPELQHLLGMKPFLSVLHAKAHGMKCEIKWGGGFQENAACTLGEEVEQANAFLSRIAISTKYMSKAARTDMITLLCMGWNQAKVQHMSSYLSRRFLKTKQSLQQQKDSYEALKTELSVDNSTILQWVTDVQEWAESAPVEDSDAPVELQKKMEEMSASIRQRTHRLYRQNDTNKGRHRMRAKIREEKGKLAALVLEHNTLVQPSERVESVELIFQPEYIFPWHVPTSDTDILTKKKVFEKVMGIRRLEEEEVVLVKEMKQHWEYLKRRAEVLEQSISGDCWNLSPKGRKGLQSLHQRKLTELKSHQAVVRQMYLQYLHLDLTEPDLDLEELLEEGQDFLSSDTSSDDHDDVNT